MLRYIAVFGFGLIFACSSKNVALKQTTPALQELILEKGFKPVSNPDFLVNQSKQIDSLLLLNVSYKGGCNGFHFKLVNNGQVMKTFPPRTTVYLVHETEKENCTENRTIDLRFNVSKLKSLNTKGTVMYKLGSSDNYFELKP